MTAVCKTWVMLVLVVSCGDRNRQMNPNHWAFEYYGFRVRMCEAKPQSVVNLKANTLTFIHRKQVFVCVNFILGHVSLSFAAWRSDGSLLTDTYIRKTENEIKNFVMSDVKTSGRKLWKTKTLLSIKVSWADCVSIFCVRFSGPFADRAVASPQKKTFMTSVKGRDAHE